MSALERVFWIVLMLGVCTAFACFTALYVAERCGK